MFFAATFASFSVAKDTYLTEKRIVQFIRGWISRRSPAVRQRVKYRALPYRYVFGESGKGFCVKVLNEG